MLQMTYSQNRAREVLYSGIYYGYKFAILNHGTHPTAYIENKPGFTDYFEINICNPHGGFTYLGEAYWDKNDTSSYIGWGYHHLGDYSGCDSSPSDKDKRWTTEEIYDEVKSVIKAFISHYISDKQHFVSLITDIALTGEDIDDIMSTALDSGIAYWCKKVEVIGDYLGEYTSDQISRGGELKFYDSESDEIYRLTLEKFLLGLKIFLSRYGYNCITDSGELDSCQLDAFDADAIIQLALFGEVIYG